MTRRDRDIVQLPAPLDADALREFVKGAWKRQTLEERAVALAGLDVLLDRLAQLEARMPYCPDCGVSGEWEDGEHDSA